MKFSIITPTILRHSLIRCCASVDAQTFRDFEHIVMVDTEITSDILSKIMHPQRFIYRCLIPHRNWGHGCRHDAWSIAKGEYLYSLDDDNFLAHPGALERLSTVTGPWAIFPILRYGERFLHDPPGRTKTDTGSFIYKKELGAWPDLNRYDADGVFVEEVLMKHPYDLFAIDDPIMVMEESGGEKIEVVPGPPRVSIYTATHSNVYLRDAYDSIKDQPFHEWILAFNHGGIPTDFGDPRVKVHTLYSSPEKVGPLKAFCCEQATGDILLELDHDDMLLPMAVEKVQKAFEDPEVGFVYSNCIHSTGDLSKFPRYTESAGWKFREVEFRGKKLDEFCSFPPTPESISRVWFGPDHLRAFRRETYKKVGGYNKDRKILDDSELVMKMYLASKFVHLDEPLYLYRVHGNNSWLRYNQEIQDGVWPLYEQYIRQLVERWCDLNGHAKMELGTSTTMKKDYSSIPLRLADLAGSKWIPRTSSVGVIRAVDSLCMLHDPLHAMREVSRILVPGGWLFIQVPSTDGRGAWQDPRHISRFNQNSFLYYTHKDWAQYIDTPVRFQAVRMYTTELDANKVSWVQAHLLSLKDGYRPCGQLDI